MDTINIRKRYPIILAALIILCALFCSSAMAEPTVVASGECGANGSNVTWALDSEGLLTISGSGDMENYDTSYGANRPAPWSSYTVKKVIINKGVTNVGDYAFKKCRITSASIPDTVTSIGMHAFASCDRLNSITIPDSVTSIGLYAFAYCEELESITLPEDITSIGMDIFYECSSNLKIYCFVGSATASQLADAFTAMRTTTFWLMIKPTRKSDRIALIEWKA